MNDYKNFMLNASNMHYIGYCFTNYYDLEVDLFLT